MKAPRSPGSPGAPGPPDPSWGLGRTLRTLRHLRPGQLGARALHELGLRAQPVLLPWTRRRYAADERARPFPLTLAPPEGKGLERARETAERWRAGTIKHLALEASRDDFAASGFPRLFRYERHYHTELVALASLAAREPQGPWAAEAAALVTAWARACPPGAPDAWEPYPVARRIFSWAEASALAPVLAPVLAPHLAAHLRFLRGHLERHLLGNHLLCDAAALVAGAAALEGEEAEGLGALGANLLARELHRQILPDGGYAERTAHYHALVLRDSLLALSFSRQRGWPLRIEREVCAQLTWLLAVRRDRFRLPCLNDAVPQARFIAREALGLGMGLDLLPNTEAGVPFALLPETGWSIVRDDRHELLFEHGPLGPDEQPGHGHSDALSYELIWDGVPVATDSGVTTYEVGSVREFERSARAHSTVTVDGEGPDELWSAFRAGARGDVLGLPSRELEHGGRRLRASVRCGLRAWTHERALLYWPGAALIVLDRVRGARPGAEILSRLCLDPRWSFEGALRGPLPLALQLLRGELAGAASGADRPREGWVSEGFGRALARTSLRLRADASGDCAYALCAAGFTVSLEGARLVLRGSRFTAEVALKPDGLPA